MTDKQRPNIWKENLASPVYNTADKLFKLVSWIAIIIATTTAHDLTQSRSLFILIVIEYMALWALPGAWIAEAILNDKWVKKIEDYRVRRAAILILFVIWLGVTAIMAFGNPLGHIVNAFTIAAKLRTCH